MTILRLSMPVYYSVYLLGNTSMLIGVGTPSDISCDTPAHEHYALSGERLSETPEDSVLPMFSPYTTATFNFNFFPPSPKLQMRSDSSPFSHVFPNSISAMSDPDPWSVQQPHVSPSTSSLVPSLSNQGPFNSLGRSYHSGLVSPSTSLAELNGSPSSLHPSEVAFNRPIHPFAQDTSHVFQPIVSKLRDIESIISPHPFLKPLLEPSLGRLVEHLFQEPIYDIERSPEVEEKRRESCLMLDGEVLTLGCTIYYDDTCSSKKAFEEVLDCLQVDSHSNEIVIRSNTKRHFSVLEAMGCTNDGRALTVAGAWKLTKAGTLEEVERLRKAVRLELECQQEWRVFGREVASSLFSSPDDNSCRRIGHCAGSVTTTSGANCRVRSFYHDIFNGRSAAEMLNSDGCLAFIFQVEVEFLVKGRFGDPILLIVDCLTIYKGGLATPY